MPKISIIVTSFNDEKYIKKCLDCILKQTFQDFEVIVVDDASKDKTPEIIKKCAAKDHRIKPYILEANGGISASRNYGISKATAPYIMFCDGDDYYEPTMCEKMFFAINNKKTDLATCEIGVFYEAHKEMKFSDDCYYKLKYSGHHVLTKDILYNIDSSVDNKIFRKDLIEYYRIRFPDNLHTGEDAFFIIVYGFVSDSIFFINEVLYHYTRRTGSAMSDTWSKNAEYDYSSDHIRIFMELHQFLTKNNLFKNQGDYEYFWRDFCDYVYAAHRWCKTNEMRDYICQQVSSFVEKNREEILTKTGLPTQKYLSRFTSNFFYSTTWKIIHKLKFIVGVIKKKLFSKFGKISTSQTWSLIKLRGLVVDTGALRARIEIIRKKTKK